MKINELAIRESVSYDPATGIFIFLRKMKNGTPAGTVAGSEHSNGYLRINIKGQEYLAHRLAYWFTYGQWAKYIDHINGNKKDNRISNLRAVSNRENSCNRSCHRSGKRPGIYQQENGHWTARIQRGPKRVGLGTYKTENEAYSAYLDAVKE